MALAQGTADFQLLTDGEGLFGTNNLEFPDTVALATLNGDEVGNGTKVDLEFAVYQLRQFLLGVAYRPTIEIGGFLIEIVEYLRKDVLIAGVAVRIVERNEIWLRGIFPAVLELLGLTTTAL